MFKPDPSNAEAYHFYREHPAIFKRVFLSGMGMGIAIGLPIGLLLTQVF